MQLLQIIVGFGPIATHDMFTEFCGRRMLQYTARLFDEMIGRFPATKTTTTKIGFVNDKLRRDTTTQITVYVVIQYDLILLTQVRQFSGIDQSIEQYPGRFCSI